ncbi:MAG: tetratricopeptide repeat protein [Candidatus Nitrosopolaris sp.]
MSEQFPFFSVSVTVSESNKGLDLGRLGNYTGAIIYLDKALAIDPHDVRTLNNKGLSLDRLGNHTGAIIYYDKALSIDPFNVNA